MFIIGVFEKPHPEFHWDNVFPQLLEFGAQPELLEEKANQPRPTLLAAGVEGKATMPMGGVAIAAAPAAPVAGGNMPGVTDQEAKDFKASIAELTKTAKQLAGAGEAAQKLTEAYGAADASIQGLAQNAQVCQQNMAVVGNSLQNMAAAAQNFEAVGAQVGSLNSLYELQIASVQAQNAAAAAMATDMQAMQAATSAALKNSEAYNTASQQLAQILEIVIEHLFQLSTMLLINGITGSSITVILALDITGSIIPFYALVFLNSFIYSAVTVCIANNLLLKILDKIVSGIGFCFQILRFFVPWSYFDLLTLTGFPEPIVQVSVTVVVTIN